MTTTIDEPGPDDFRGLSLLEWKKKRIELMRDRAAAGQPIEKASDQHLPGPAIGCDRENLRDDDYDD